MLKDCLSPPLHLLPTETDLKSLVRLCLQRYVDCKFYIQMCDLIIVGVVGELVEVDVVGLLGKQGLQVINLAQDTSHGGSQMDT